MIKLYIKDDKIPSDERLVYLNDNYFNSSVRALDLSVEEETMIEQIDKAIIIDKVRGTVKTPFGTTDLKHLSTGCKTLINIMRNKNGKIVFSLNGCSYNILDMIFDRIDNSDTKVFLNTNEISSCKDREFLIEGMVFNRALEVAAYIMRGDG